MNKYTESVKYFFDKTSIDYHKNFNNIKSSKNYTFLKRKKIVLKNLYKKKGKFLDVGTGSGQITTILVNKNNFSKSFLVDISNPMLNECKKKIKKKKGVTFINKDFTLLNTRIKFNYIICLGVIAHYQNTNKLVAKISSLSKKNSIVIIQSSLFNFFTVKMNKFFFFKRYQRNNKYNIQYMTEKNLIKLFTNNNFEIIKIYRYSLSMPIIDKFLPKLNFYLDYYFDLLFKNIGAEAIFILKKNKNV
jgi:ubiquinone/menaquinone biosynthesis C-methylase UbiE